MNRTIDEEVEIKTRIASKEYREGWERIFGEEEPAKEPQPEPGDPKP